MLTQTQIDNIDNPFVIVSKEKDNEFFLCREYYGMLMTKCVCFSSSTARDICDTLNEALWRAQNDS